ncbi:MAG: clostripain-related cysteine peptidase, partial [candidate division WOR-3 bacterium]
MHQLLELLFGLVLAVPGLAAKWTAMIYMCADNGMSDQSYVDLQEMTRAGAAENVNTIIQVDRAAFDSLPRPRRYRVLDHDLELLAELPELDMTDPANLEEFVRFCRDHYHADNYLLVLWDHGNGWSDLPGAERQEIGGLGPKDLGRPPPPDPAQLGILYDASSGNWLGVADGGLGQALNGIKKLLGRKLSVLVLDACLMQMTEVAHEVKDAVEFLAASEDLQPFNGLPYDEVLGLLKARSDISPREFARQLPELVVGSYSGGSQGHEIVTFSTLDLTRLGPALRALDEWLAAVTSRAQSDIMGQARRTVQAFCSEYPDPNRFNDHVDLIDFVALSREVAPGPADRLMTTLSEVVLAQAQNDSSLGNARGVAVWFPDNYLALKADFHRYCRLTWARTHKWLEFLNCFFGADDLKPDPVSVKSSRVGRRNDFQLDWSRAFDLAPVRYQVFETSDLELVFDDPVDDFTRWQNQGFRRQELEGRTTFYSGTGDSLNCVIALREPLALPDGGLVEFQLRCNSYEAVDTMGIFYRDKGYFEYSADAVNWVSLDSFYGRSDTWQRCRYLVPAGQCWLRFRYSSRLGLHWSGFWLDSVAAWALTGFRLVAPDVRDTSIRFFNHRQGTFQFVVVPGDSFGNIGYVSPFASVTAPDYAEP